jgi:uncharacterized OB-fold protein
MRPHVAPGRDLVFAMPRKHFHLGGGVGTGIARDVDGAEREPPIVGLVELEEGPWLHARLVDVDTATLSVGDALVVGFEPAGEETVPIFRPA